MACLNWNMCQHDPQAAPLGDLLLCGGWPWRRTELQMCLGASAGAQMWQPDLWAGISQSKVPLYPPVCWLRLDWKCKHNPGGVCVCFYYGRREFLLLDRKELAEGSYIAPTQILRHGKLM